MGNEFKRALVRQTSIPNVGCSPRGPSCTPGATLPAVCPATNTPCARGGTSPAAVAAQLELELCAGMAAHATLGGGGGGGPGWLGAESGGPCGGHCGHGGGSRCCGAPSRTAIASTSGNLFMQVAHLQKWPADLGWPLCSFPKMAI
jgi:hypothetical protein